MSEELVFYTNPLSRGRMVRWMLEEVGEPYRTEVLDYSAMKDPAYLAINPMGKVPALTHGRETVTECAAICVYLADAFPEAALAPPVRDPQRAAYYRWLFFAAGPVEAAVTNKAAGFEAPPERARMLGYGTYASTMDTLEKAVSDGYLAGNRFSAADLYVGSHINWGMRFGTLEKRPAFERYVALLVSRPAYLRANEIDDKLAAQMQGGAQGR